MLSGHLRGDNSSAEQAQECEQVDVTERVTGKLEDESQQQVLSRHLCGDRSSAEQTYECGKVDATMQDVNSDIAILRGDTQQY